MSTLEQIKYSFKCSSSADDDDDDAARYELLRRNMNDDEGRTLWETVVAIVVRRYLANGKKRVR